MISRGEKNHHGKEKKEFPRKERRGPVVSLRLLFGLKLQPDHRHKLWLLSYGQLLAASLWLGHDCELSVGLAANNGRPSEKRSC